MRANGRLRVPASGWALAGLLIGSLTALAINAASDKAHWPGPLQGIHSHPWLATAVLVAVGGWLALRQTRTDGGTATSSQGVLAVRLLSREQPPTPAEQVEGRQFLLARVRQFWVDGVLGRDPHPASTGTRLVASEEKTEP